MGNLWLALLSLSLAATHGVKGCLECDPKFIEDIWTLLTNMVHLDVPDRTQLLQRHFKLMLRLSFHISHRDKMLWVLAVSKVVKLRTWLKDEFYRLGNETWKGVFIFQGKLLDIHQNLESKVKETLKNFCEVAVIEGPTLDCWTCLHMSAQCFKGEYCGEDDPRKAENQEIALFLIFLTEAAVLASAVLLFHICVSHWRKMKQIRRTLQQYLEKKLEELVWARDKQEKNVLNSENE